MAEDNSTFSALANIKDEPGEPLVFLSMDWMLTEFEGAIPEHVPQPSAKFTEIPQSTPLKEVPAGFEKWFTLPPNEQAGCGRNHAAGPAL